MSDPSSPRPTRAQTTVDGRPVVHPLIRSVKPVLDALGASFVAADAMEASDVALVWEGRTIAAVRMPPLHGALDRLIDAVEAELGGRLPLLSREDKQRAVRLLDERGAFILRRAVEDVADAMGVSRITVYNYLNAIHR
jgi:HTH domain